MKALLRSAPGAIIARRDISRLQDRVLYLDNDVNLDSQELDVPDAGDPIDG